MIQVSRTRITVLNWRKKIKLFMFNGTVELFTALPSAKPIEKIMAEFYEVHNLRKD